MLCLQVTVVMEPFGWLVAEMSLKVEWRSAMKDFGNQYAAVEYGMVMMLRLFAENLDSLKEEMTNVVAPTIITYASMYIASYPCHVRVGCEAVRIMYIMHMPLHCVHFSYRTCTCVCHNWVHLQPKKRTYLQY